MLTELLKYSLQTVMIRLSTIQVIGSMLPLALISTMSLIRLLAMYHFLYSLMQISVSDILHKLTQGITRCTVCVGFTILIYMFLIFGSSMRKFERTSLRYKIENQVFFFILLHQITGFLIIKTILSFIAGFIVYCIYGLILHIPMALIFSFLFFILNYIPHIVYSFHSFNGQGPIIATCIPIPLICFDPRFDWVEIGAAILLPSVGLSGRFDCRL